MKRREFIKTATSAAAIGSSASALFGQSAPSNTLRIAVMGCHEKGRGFQLLKVLAKMKGVEVAAVCDVDSRGMDAAAAHVVEVSGKTPKKDKDIRRLLDDKNIDCVLCAAPDHWHAPAALMAMKAGKGIYVEKPFTHNPAEGEILMQAAAKYKVPFQMGTQRRGDDLVRTVIKKIHEGLIGETYYARCWYSSGRGAIGKGKEVPVPEWLDWDLWQGPAPRQKYRDNIVHYTWHWFKHWGTGESGNNATHYVDIARWALNAKYPVRSTCGGGRLFYEGDDWEFADTMVASYEFPDRKFLTWEGLSSARARPYEGIGTGCTIYGKKGVIRFGGNPRCVQFNRKGEEVHVFTGADTILDDAAENRTNPTGGLTVIHIGNWLDAVRNNTTDTYMPVEESHASVLLTQLANISIETGESIKTDPETGKLVKGSAGAEQWAREYEKGWEMKL